MRKQAVNQAFENNSMEVELEGLRKSIARWTVLDGLNHDRDFCLVAFSAGRSHRPDEPHVRAEHLLDRTRGQTRAARRRHVCV